MPTGCSRDADLASGGCTCRGAAPAALRQPPPQPAGLHARSSRHRPSPRLRPLPPGGPGQHRVSAAQKHRKTDAVRGTASARTTARPPPETQFGGKGWTGGSHHSGHGSYRRHPSAAAAARPGVQGRWWGALGPSSCHPKAKPRSRRGLRAQSRATTCHRVTDQPHVMERAPQDSHRRALHTATACRNCRVVEQRMRE